jgi:hypothetical protein
MTEQEKEAQAKLSKSEKRRQEERILTSHYQSSLTQRNLEYDG